MRLEFRHGYWQKRRIDWAELGVAAGLVLMGLLILL